MAAARPVPRERPSGRVEEPMGPVIARALGRVLSSEELASGAIEEAPAGPVYRPPGTRSATATCAPHGPASAKAAIPGRPARIRGVRPTASERAPVQPDARCEKVDRGRPFPTTRSSGFRRPGGLADRLRPHLLLLWRSGPLPAASRARRSPASPVRRGLRPGTDHKGRFPGCAGTGPTRPFPRARHRRREWCRTVRPRAGRSPAVGEASGASEVRHRKSGRAAEGAAPLCFDRFVTSRRARGTPPPGRSTRRSVEIRSGQWRGRWLEDRVGALRSGVGFGSGAPAARRLGPNPSRARRGSPDRFAAAEAASPRQVRRPRGRGPPERPRRRPEAAVVRLGCSCRAARPAVPGRSLSPAVREAGPTAGNRGCVRSPCGAIRGCRRPRAGPAMRSATRRRRRRSRNGVVAGEARGKTPASWRRANGGRGEPNGFGTRAGRGSGLRGSAAAPFGRVQGSDGAFAGGAPPGATRQGRGR